jgi:hypothetical protein
MTDTRRTYRTMIIGKQGSGKTTFAKKLALKYPKKVLVIVADDFEPAWKNFPLVEMENVGKLSSGKRRIIYEPENKEFINDLKHRFAGGLIIWDDAKTYFRSQKSINELENMLIRSRQFNVEHVFMYHGLSTIPGMIWSYLTHLVLFATNDAHVRAKDRTFNYELMIERVNHVNAEAKKNEHFHEIYPLS